METRRAMKHRAPSLFDIALAPSSIGDVMTEVPPLSSTPARARADKSRKHGADSAATSEPYGDAMRTSPAVTHVRLVRSGS